MRVQTHDRAVTGTINTLWELPGGGLPASMGERKWSGFITPKEKDLFKVSKRLFF